MSIYCYVHGVCTPLVACRDVYVSMLRVKACYLATHYFEALCREDIKVSSIDSLTTVSYLP